MRALVFLAMLMAACAGRAAQAPHAWPQMVRQDLRQGGFYVGLVPPGSKVVWDKETVAVDAGGVFVLGFDRFQPQENRLEVCVADICEERTLRVKPRTYVVQKVTKVPQNTVDPSEEEIKRAREDSVAIGLARGLAMKEAGTGIADVGRVFRLPVTAPTSGVYGSRRIYNGQERSWHKGHDLAAPTGTPVKAPADGVVRLARNTFFSGNLIMLDHGHGLASVFAHLSKMQVKVGQRVKAGEVVGRVGTTGRSSGPHLHWGMYWKTIAIDPILWAEEQK